MYILKLNREVVSLFKECDENIACLKEKNGIDCLPGCSNCCLKTNIYASILEFIPLALYLYSENTIHDWQSKLENNKSGTCVFYDESKAKGSGCLIYPYRGLLCRLFGFSGKFDKSGKTVPILCKPLFDSLKNQKKEILQKTNPKMPIIADYYLKPLDPTSSRI